MLRAPPDLVFVQEAQGVERFRRIAAELEMMLCPVEGRGSVPPRAGLLSRLPVLGFRTLCLWPVWLSCLQAHPARERARPEGLETV